MKQLNAGEIWEAIFQFNQQGHPGLNRPIDVMTYVSSGEVRPDVYAVNDGPFVVLAFGHKDIAFNVLLFKLYPGEELKGSKMLDLLRLMPYRCIKFNAMRDRYAAIVKKYGGKTWKQDGRFFYQLELGVLDGYFKRHS